MKEINILIADDHKIILDGISSIINTIPHVNIIGEASNGEELLDLLNFRNKETDLVITDISMMPMNGIEACKQIKLLYPNIKVLMLSMYGEKSTISEAIYAEADGFLLKNSGRQELLEAIHRTMEHGTYYSDKIKQVLIGIEYDQIKRNQDTSNLSPRELQVLELIVNEHTSEEIAQKLNISKKTVDNHRANLLSKTNTNSTVGLVKFALKNKIG